MFSCKKQPHYANILIDFPIEMLNSDFMILCHMFTFVFKELVYPAVDFSMFCKN